MWTVQQASVAGTSAWYEGAQARAGRGVGAAAGRRGAQEARQAAADVRLARAAAAHPGARTRASRVLNKDAGRQPCPTPCKPAAPSQPADPPHASSPCPHLESHNELALALACQVDVPKLAPPQRLANVKVGELPSPHHGGPAGRALTAGAAGLGAAGWAGGGGNARRRRAHGARLGVVGKRGRRRGPRGRLLHAKHVCAQRLQG